MLQGWIFWGYLLTKNGFEWKSKMVHEQDQILTDFDDFGVVEKLRIRAFQRYQKHKKRLGIDPLQGPLLIRPKCIFRK